MNPNAQHAASPGAASTAAGGQAPRTLPNILGGAWVTTYSNFVLGGSQPAPGITLGVFLFDFVNGVTGTLRPNVTGRVNNVISFDGTYSMVRDHAHDMLTGIISINLPVGGSTAKSKNDIHYVMKTADELHWVLLGSSDPNRNVVAGGTMSRVQHIWFDPGLPGDHGPLDNQPATS